MEKILFLTTNLDVGGSERRCITLARQFKQRGYFVSIACLSKNSNGFFLDILEKEQIKVLTIDGENFYKASRLLRNYIVTESIDAVISILYKPNLVNCLAAIGKHNWIVIVGEPAAFRQTHRYLGWKYVLKSDIMARFYKFANFIVCNSYNAKNDILRYFPNYESKLKVIYNPVNIEDIDTDYIVRKDGKTHICVAASYQEVKNPINVAKALSLLEDSEKKKCVIEWYGHIHSPKLYNQLQDIIKDCSIEGCFKLNGPTKEIYKIMNRSDCVALFSVVEGLPNSICEGMTLGKPIIMSRCSDCNVLVSDNGFLCNWNEPESIKEAIVSIINLPTPELLEYGRKSKQKAVELLDKNDIITQWLNLSINISKLI